MSELPEDDIYIARERLEFPQRKVAVVVVVNAEEEILLVRTRRLPNHWQPLGGGIDGPDISPESTAIREAEEELGVRLLPSSLRRVCEAPYDFGSGTVYFFISPAPRSVTFRVNEHELVAWQWFCLDQALTLPMFPATATCLRLLANSRTLLIDAARQAA